MSAKPRILYISNSYYDLFKRLDFSDDYFLKNLKKIIVIKTTKRVSYYSKLFMLLYYFEKQILKFLKNFNLFNNISFIKNNFSSHNYNKKVLVEFKNYNNNFDLSDKTGINIFFGFDKDYLIQFFNLNSTCFLIELGYGKNNSDVKKLIEILVQEKNTIDFMIYGIVQKKFKFNFVYKIKKTPLLFLNFNSFKKRFFYLCSKIEKF